MKKIFSLAILLFLNINIAAADDQLKKDVVDTTTDFISNRFLNAVFDIREGDDIIVKGANGLYSVENKIKLKAEQTMPVASVTKSMTAASILKLKDRGLLDVNDTVAKHLDAKSAVWKDGKIPEWANKVTIHNLLTHSSGISEYFMAASINPDAPQEEINKTILDFAANHELNFQPGEKVVYTNTNYVLLGLIIEQKSGLKVAEFFKKELFEPLGMNDTRMLEVAEAVEGQRNPTNSTMPVRYFVTPTGGDPQYNIAPADYIMIPYADGGVVSTASDLIKWHQALHSGKVVSDESLKLMKTKHYPTNDRTGQKNFVGYGLFIAELENGLVLYHHAGNALAIRCESGYIPEKNIYFAVLSNVMNYAPKEIAEKIDYNDPNNQLDIIYFTQAIFKTVK